MNREYMHIVHLSCEAGHRQTIRIDPKAMNEDMAHDFGVLIAGGTLRSIGREMPGYPCAWAPSSEHEPCGAKTSFELEPAHTHSFGPRGRGACVCGMTPEDVAKKVTKL